MQQGPWFLAVGYKAKRPPGPVLPSLCRETRSIPDPVLPYSASSPSVLLQLRVLSMTPWA